CRRTAERGLRRRAWTRRLVSHPAPCRAAATLRDIAPLGRACRILRSRRTPAHVGCGARALLLALAIRRAGDPTELSRSRAARWVPGATSGSDVGHCRTLLFSTRRGLPRAPSGVRGRQRTRSLS